MAIDFEKKCIMVLAQRSENTCSFHPRCSYIGDLHQDMLSNAYVYQHSRHKTMCKPRRWWCKSHVLQLEESATHRSSHWGLEVHFQRLIDPNQNSRSDIFSIGDLVLQIKPCLFHIYVLNSVMHSKVASPGEERKSIGFCCIAALVPGVGLK